MIREHTDRQYAAELRELRNRLLLMTGRVEQMIARSVEAVVNQDTDLDPWPPICASSPWP
jgi:phosphate uptake regulator